MKTKNRPALRLELGYAVVFLLFCLLGSLFGLSFYQNSESVGLTNPFWTISLFIPITLYISFVRYKKIIQTLARAFWLGFVFGLAFFATSLHWLIKAPLEVMGMDWGLSLTLVGLMISIFSLSLAPFFLVIHLATNSNRYLSTKLANHDDAYFWTRLKKWITEPLSLYCLVLPSFWVTLEWLRAEILFMPLLNIAHPQIDNFLASLANVFGVYGIGFVIWLLTGLVFLISQNHPKTINKYAISLALILVSLYSYHQFVSKNFQRSAADGYQKFALIQGNVSQSEKFDGLSLESEINRYFYFSSEFKDSIILWPETAIATFRSQVENLINDKLNVIDKNESVILSGIVLEQREVHPNDVNRENEKNYYTALANLADVNQNYTKTKLVIFGEYIPFLDLLKTLIEKIETPYSSYSKGALNQAEMRVKNANIGTGICFEGAYGRLYARYDTANVLVNISNDAWFDHSPALPMLMNAIRYRSIEMGRFMVRSANTGITAFIEPSGKIIRYLAPYQAGAIWMNVPLMNHKTIYSQLRDWPIVLLSLLFMCLFSSVFISNRH